MSVRRLAAIDMYGAKGTVRRRRIVLVEFVGATFAMVAFGVWLVAVASSVTGVLIGWWAIGAGLNYAPLAAYAILFSRPGALAAELSGVDIGPELRRYAVRQLWILVPLSLVVLSIRENIRVG